MKQKRFYTYEDAYEAYVQIVAGKDPDRKNASIFYIDGMFVLMWMPR